MPSTFRVSTAAAGSPAAAASFMQSASLKTTPSKRSTAGLRICVLGAPPSGREIFVAFDADGDLVLRAGEREPYPFVAGQQRALGKFLQDRGKFAWRRAGGSRNAVPAGLSPAGMKVTAPAHSPPICSSMA